MRYGGSVTGEAAALKDKFLIGSTVTAGQPLCMSVFDATTTVPLSGAGGVLVLPSKTALQDVWGLAEEAGTKSTTKGSAGVEAEIVYSPLAIYDAVISGGTGDDENTALTINEQDTADSNALILDDAGLASDSMVGGLIYGLTGANVGQRRIITSYTSADSCGWAGNPFDVTIASGDDFLIFGASRALTGIALTTNFTQVPQHFPNSAADRAEAAVIDVLIDDYDQAAPTARVLFVVRDHILNPS
jgi:hypothetical protein